MPFLLSSQSENPEIVPKKMLISLYSRTSLQFKWAHKKTNSPNNNVLCIHFFGEARTRLISPNLGKNFSKILIKRQALQLYSNRGYIIRLKISIK